MNSPKQTAVSPKLLAMLDYCFVSQLINSIVEFSKPAFSFSKKIKRHAGFNSLYREFNSLYLDRHCQLITHNS